LDGLIIFGPFDKTDVYCNFQLRIEMFDIEHCVACIDKNVELINLFDIYQNGLDA